MPGRRPTRAPFPFPGHDPGRGDVELTELRARLVEVEERLDRVGQRMTAGHGSDSDRDGWLLWLRQLEARRAALRARLGEDAGRVGPGAPSG